MPVLLEGSRRHHPGRPSDRRIPENVKSFNSKVTDFTVHRRNLSTPSCWRRSRPRRAARPRLNRRRGAPPQEITPAHRRPRPPQNTYEYRVVASKVQKGMNTVNTLVRLEAADGKQVDAFAPGEHHALTMGTLLTGVCLSVRRQDTVVFYVLEDYRIATDPQAA